MVLGTAQFGLKYGIANIYGIPQKSESLYILKTAWSKGVRHFDTAPGYKTESLIGEFITSEGLQDKIHILTKIPLLKKDSKWKKSVYNSITNSFKSLKCNEIEVLFFHNPYDSIYLIKEPEFFRNLLSNFPIKSLGISVYNPIEIENVKGCGFNLASQFPFNLFDRRFENNTVPIGKRYARSIFLQGFLASKTLIEKAPEELKRIHSTIIKDCKNNDISLIQQAFKFVVDSRFLDFFLVGVDSTPQLEQLFNLDLNIDINFTIVEKWISLFNNKWLDPLEWLKHIN